MARLALIQYRITAEPANTFRCVCRLLKLALKQNPDGVILPEMWLGGPTTARSRIKWAALYKDAFEELRDWSRDHQVAVFCSQLEQAGKEFFNTAYYMGPSGETRFTYRKRHLFHLGGEGRIYHPGRDTPRYFQSLLGKTGFAICYDLRFPEYIRDLSHRGMQVLIVCAQWPASRMDHWLSLLKARAIENQIYVIGVNRLGVKKLSGRIERYTGHSVAFDPWGDSMLELGTNRNIGMVRIDLERLKKIRSQYPFFKERRLKSIRYRD